MLLILLVTIVLVCQTATGICGAIVDFESLGAIAGDASYEVMWANGALLNKTFNSLGSGDVFVLPNATYYTAGGILVTNQLINVKIVIDGSLIFDNDRNTWPRDSGGNVLECLQFNYLENVVITSSGGSNNRGTIDGQGKAWWGAIKYLRFAEDRPRLIHILQSKNLLVEKIAMINSPFWTFWAQNCQGMVVRYSEIDARWDNADRHTLLDLQAFNTDGIDVTGRDVYVHDIKVWNGDDCVCVKDNSEDMLFENIEASGLGLTVGSIGGSRVNNITFRNAVMKKTVKGIYMKTRWSDKPPTGSDVGISNVLFENITIIEPEQFAIWIGPAQQNGQPCSLLWPEVSQAECLMSGYQTWANITLKDVTVVNPMASPGVLIGNNSNPVPVVFDNVVVQDMRDNLKPWGGQYYCEDGGVDMTVTSHETSPRPDCFVSREFHYY